MEMKTLEPAATKPSPQGALRRAREIFAVSAKLGFTSFGGRSPISVIFMRNT